MANHIEPGDTCIVTHDIVISGVVAFSRGEQVVIEKMVPNTQRPEYKYVVYSARLDSRFQLCDANIFPSRTTLARQEVASTDRRWVTPAIIAGSAALVVAAVIVVMLLFVFGPSLPEDDRMYLVEMQKSIDECTAVIADSLECNQELTEELEERLETNQLSGWGSAISGWLDDMKRYSDELKQLKSPSAGDPQTKELTAIEGYEDEALDEAEKASAAIDAMYDMFTFEGGVVSTSEIFDMMLRSGDTYATASTIDNKRESIRKHLDKAAENMLSAQLLIDTHLKKYDMVSSDLIE